MATDYYVATDGDDADPGTLAEPFLTIQHGLDQATSPGDTVYVRAGTYTEDILLSSSGTSGNPITLSGYATERPIIDGEYTKPTGSTGGTCPYGDENIFVWAALVDITGDYVTLNQLEVKRSQGFGIDAESADHTIISDCEVHHCRYSTVKLGSCTSGLIEDSTIYMSCDYCPHSRSSGAANWGAGITVRDCDTVTVRNCTVYNNWSEGIDPIRGSTNIIIEDCIVYNCFSPHIYVDRANNITIRRNLVYHDGTDFLRNGSAGRGIGIADEDTGDNSYLIDIYNNIVVGCREGFFHSDPTAQSGLDRVNVVFNTFVEQVALDPEDAAVGISIAAGTHATTIIKNNIILQTDDTIASVPDDADLDFDYNNWSRATDTDAQGANDVVANPDLVDSGHALVGGEVQAAWYQLRSVSPGREAGLAIGGITDDYWETTRSDPPDIGAHEFVPLIPPIAVLREPGASFYKLRFYSAAGALVAEIVNFEELCYAKRVNSPGLCTFTLDGDHAAIDLLEHRSQIEVWRANPNQQLDWHCDFYGLYLSPNRFQSERNVFTTVCPGQMWLLGTRYVAWYADTADRTKFASDPAETIMKTLVDYNACANATTGNGRLRNGAITGLSIQTDGGRGNSLDWNCAWRNLLTTLQGLALVAGGDFDLIKTAAQAWKFRWYTGQRGDDRSASVVFARERGNMMHPHYRHDRLNEKTVAIVGGQGEKGERDIVIRTGDDYSASNDVEIFVDAKNRATTAGYNAAGDKRLSELQARQEFSFEVVQTPSCFYGQVASGGDYELGDLTTARAFGVECEPKVVGVTVTVIPAADSCETIDIDVETP